MLSTTTRLTPAGDRRVQHILGAEHIGAHRLHRVELAGGHLLQRRGVEDVVDAAHRVADAVVVAHVADVELELVVCERDAACLPASSRRG